MAAIKALRAVPLARVIAVAELALLVRDHVIRLEPNERRRVIELVRRGRGRPSRLTPGERLELAGLVAKLEPRMFATSAAKKLVPIRPTKLRRR